MTFDVNDPSFKLEDLLKLELHKFEEEVREQLNCLKLAAVGWEDDEGPMLGGWVVGWVVGRMTRDRCAILYLAVNISILAWCILVIYLY